MTASDAADPAEPSEASNASETSEASETPETSEASEAPENVPALASWTPVLPFDQHLFPALILVTENPGFRRWPAAADDLPVIGREHGWLSAEVQAGRDDCPFRLVVSCKDLMEESVLEGVLESSDIRYRLIPKIVWKFDQLAVVRQPVLENLTFELFLDGERVDKQVVTVQMHTINDCPAYFSDGEQELDTSWMMAAYVNEDHPWIDRILQEALQTGTITEFDGYQSEDQANVLLQVFAIWYVMQKKGMKYSSIHPTAAVSEGISSQHVRFLDEALENTQANCVDGSVLLASILRKIGLNPYLVSFPQHVLLAFDLDGEGDEIAFLETTTMGELDLEGSDALEAVKKKLKNKKAQEDSWNSFSAAIAAGEEAFGKHRKRFLLHDPDYQIISLEEARNSGIMPIPFRKK